MAFRPLISRTFAENPMEVHLEKISLHLQPVGDGDKDHKLAMKGEEQEDGSLILRLSVVDKSGKPLPLRWKGDFDEDKCGWIEEKE